MGIREWFGFGASEAAPAVQREITIPARDPWASTTATPTTAITIPTVYRCVALLTQTVQHAMDKCLTGFKPVPMQSFEYDMTRYSWTCS